MSLDELLLLSGELLAIGAPLVAAPIGGLYSVCRRRLAAAGAEDARARPVGWLALCIESVFAALMLLVEFVFAATILLLNRFGSSTGD